MRNGLALALVALGFFSSPAEGQERGWLGIAFDTAERAGGELVVDQVAVDSPADDAGIEPGDRIVRWDGSVDVIGSLQDARLEEGDTVRLRVAREGQAERDVLLVAEPRDELVERRVGRGGDVIVLRPDGIARRLRIVQEELMQDMDGLQERLRILFSDSLRPRLERLERELPRIEMMRDSLLFMRDGLGLAVAGGRSTVAGASLTDVTPGLGSYFGTETGALVLRVAPETPAARAGLQEGDVIVRADGAEVEDVQDLRRALRSVNRPMIYVDGIRVEPDDADAPDRDIDLEILRQRSRYTITLSR